VTSIISDFDGVHTTNTAWIDEAGNESVEVNRSDGLGIQSWLGGGNKFVIISKERKELASKRAAKLSVQCLSGVDDKVKEIEKLTLDKYLTRQTIYIGNDVNDIPAMQFIGLSACVFDSHEEVLQIANVITRKKGGRGAVRELIDIIEYSKKGICFRCFWHLDQVHLSE
jgi:N-acylneuraminate cytidylyltransferase